VKGRGMKITVGEYTGYFLFYLLIILGFPLVGIRIEVEDSCFDFFYIRGGDPLALYFLFLYE
jgi:hypothetical protein